MKRIILFLIIIAVALGFVFYKKHGVVLAGASNNQNFVSVEKFESVLQTNLNLIWDELEAHKNSISSINDRLDAIEKSINEINSKLE